MTDVQSNLFEPDGNLDTPAISLDVGVQMRAEKFDFADQLSAHIAGDSSPAAYRERMEMMLGNLDKLKTPKKIETESDYKSAYAIKSALCSLACYTSNNHHPSDDLAWSLENVWGTALVKYNRKLQLKSSEDITVANYLLSKSRYVQLDHVKLIQFAKTRGFLRLVNGKLAVIGLNKKIQDNVTRVDSRGREYSLFVSTIGRQFFMVEIFSTDEFQNDQSLLAGIPELGDDYFEGRFGDFKGGSRRPAIDKNAYKILFGIVAKESEKPKDGV
jgi:hypothetical protein